MNKVNIEILSTCLLLLGIIFTIDLNLPLGVAGGVPYVVVILVASRTQNKLFLMSLALFCSFLVIIGYFYSPPGSEQWKILTNRALALFVIWMSAILLSFIQEEKENAIRVEIAAEKDKEKIYLATLSSSQHILNNLLNQLQFIKMEIEHCDTENGAAEHMDTIIQEGSHLMKKLSNIDHVDAQVIRQSVNPESNS